MAVLDPEREKCTQGLGVPACAIKSAVQKDIGRRQRREYLFVPPRWVLRLFPPLQEPRDEPVLYLLISICATTVPSAICVLLCPLQWHLLGAAHLVFFYALLLPRFVVAFTHVTEHRALFQRDHVLANALPGLLLTPLFGVPSGVYKLHHRVMHHCEDNGAPLDISSTEPYQRDNPLHFIMYWLRHASLTWLELPIYALRRGHVRLAAQCLAAVLLYAGALAALYCVRPVAALWVFILPYFLSTLAMMFGNWCQHMFINPACPRSAYGMAYNCVASGDNGCTFNDGYHVLHHLNSHTHWADLPARFLHYLDQHIAQQALVFEGWGVIEVGLATFARDYEALVDRMLLPYCKPKDAATRAQAAALIKSRLRPIRVPAAAGKSA